MKTFSERNGYVKASDLIIQEKITPDVQNAIINCYNRLSDHIRRSEHYTVNRKLQLWVWVFFLNRVEEDFNRNLNLVLVNQITEYLKTDEDKKDTSPNKHYTWYRKLDLIEKTLVFLQYCDQTHKTDFCTFLVRDLNDEFERLNFGYRIVDNLVAPLTDEMEIEAVEKAIQTSDDNIRLHLHSALSLYSQRPSPHYANSIKESISAVEVYCRERVGGDTLGKALNNIKKKGGDIPRVLNSAFETLYGYTCEEGGIRHGLMDPTGKYIPGPEEALFMIVACSAFINYLRAKWEKNLQ